MAAENLAKRLQDEMTCPICLDYFTVPVTLDCDHSFCSACIMWCRAQSPTGTFCPVCKRAFQLENLKRNQKLVNLVEITKEISGLERLGEGKACGKHQEPLKLFCKDDGVLVCVICHLSKEHQGHSMIPAEEAAQEYKKQMETECQNISAKFQELRHFLRAQEALMLTRITQIREQIERLRDDLVARLDQELAACDELIQEMEEKKELPACQFLQEACGILERRKQKLENMMLRNSTAFPDVLQWQTGNYTDGNPILESTMEDSEEHE